MHEGECQYHFSTGLQKITQGVTLTKRRLENQAIPGIYLENGKNSKAVSATFSKGTEVGMHFHI